MLHTIPNGVIGGMSSGNLDEIHGAIPKEIPQGIPGEISKIISSEILSGISGEIIEAVLKKRSGGTSRGIPEEIPKGMSGEIHGGITKGSHSIGKFLGKFFFASLQNFL